MKLGLLRSRARKPARLGVDWFASRGGKIGRGRTGDFIAGSVFVRPVRGVSAPDRFPVERRGVAVPLRCSLALFRAVDAAEARLGGGAGGGEEVIGKDGFLDLSSSVKSIGENKIVAEEVVRV